MDLQLAYYYEEEESRTNSHQKVIRAVASLFLNKCQNIHPADVYSNSAQLVEIMHEEHISQNLRIERLEGFVRKLVSIDEEKVKTISKGEIDPIARKIQESIRKLNSFYSENMSDLKE